jgi:hypothetical protein
MPSSSSDKRTPQIRITPVVDQPNRPAPGSRLRTQRLQGMTAKLTPSKEFYGHTKHTSTQNALEALATPAAGARIRGISEQTAGRAIAGYGPNSILSPTTVLARAENIRFLAVFLAAEAAAITALARNAAEQNEVIFAETIAPNLASAACYLVALAAATGVSLDAGMERQLTVRFPKGTQDAPL